jgi:hypothetical protein
MEKKTPLGKSIFNKMKDYLILSPLILMTLPLSNCIHSGPRLDFTSDYGTRPKLKDVLNKENISKFNFYFNNSEDKYIIIDPKKDDYNVDVKGKNWEKIDSRSKLEEKINQIPNLNENDVYALSAEVPCYENKEGIQRVLISYFVGDGKDRNVIINKKSRFNKNFIINSINKKQVLYEIGGGDGPGGDGGATGGEGGNGGDGGATGGGSGVGGNGCGAAGGAGGTGGGTGGGSSR